MSDSSKLSEVAQGLHLGHANAASEKSSIRSAATAAAAAYAWRKASRRKDGSGARSGLTVVPSRPSAEGFMTTTNGSPSPPVLGRRISTSAVTLTHQLSFGSRDAEPAPDVAVDSRSVLNEARAKLATVEKKTVDQWRKAAAEAKALSKVEKGEERIQQLEHQLSRIEDELRDAALIEVALYSVVAEHGSSAHKVHTPARRLARFYKYSYKNWSLERRAAIAKNIVSGLVLVARACGNDVPRLTYWWSNVVVLRETISQACEDSDVGSSGADGDADSSLGNDFQARAFRSQQLRKSKSDISYLLSPQGANKDWRTSAMLGATLFRIESWLHARVLESVWWQAMTPRMQLGGMHTANAKGSSADLNGDLSKFAGDSRDFAKDKMNYNSRKLGDTRQGNLSVEIWKRAFTDALKRLCPLQGEGLECGCLPALNRMIIEECVLRLDVAMFNGILRDPDDDSPTDPLADPITDLSVLPIPIGGLTFGAGSHLKNVVVNWSTWLSALVSCQDRVPAEFRSSLPEDAEDEEPVQFNLLKATGDLLMLPKDILLDAEIRKEVCPGLNLPLIRRVLANFAPDVFSPDPISPGLLNALATEVANERRKFGEDDISPDDIAMACVPPVSYSPPPTSFVKLWIGEPANSTQWGKSPSSALRKGYTSDDELEEYENPLSLLHDKPRYGADNGSGKKKKREGLGASRFQLLKEVWANP